MSNKILYWTIVLCFLPLFGFSTDYTLTTSGDWNVASNWSPVGIPGVGDKAILGSGKVVTIASNIQISNLEITNGMIEGNAKLDVLSELIWLNGNITGTDTMTIFGNADINGGTIEQKQIVFKSLIQRTSGQLQIYGGGHFIIDSSAVLTSNLAINSHLFIGSNFILGLGRITNFGKIIKNNNLVANIVAGFQNGLEFNNYGKIIINEGEILMGGVKGYFENDSITIEQDGFLTMTGFNSFTTEYLFNNTKISGGGYLKNQYTSGTWHFNTGTEVTCGIFMNSAGIIYDHIGVEIKYLYMTSGQFKGNGNTKIMDSLYISGGTIGETGNTGSVTVFGNAKIDGGSVTSKMLLFKNNIFRSTGQFHVYGGGQFVIDTTAVLTSNFTNNGNLFLGTASNNGIGYIVNHGTLIKNNSGAANISAGFPNGLDFKNYGKILINGGELYMLGLNAEFQNDTITVCPTCNLTMVSHPTASSNYIFNGNYISGDGALKNVYPGSKWYFNNGTGLDVGIVMSESNAIVYDNIGVTLKYLYLNSGHYRGSGNTIINDSLFWSSGVVGEIGNTGTFTVNGNAQVNGGSVISKTVIFNNIVNRSSSSFGVYNNGKIRFTATAVVNLNFTNNQTVFTSNHTIGTVENFGIINKLDNKVLTFSSTGGIDRFLFYNFGVLNVEYGEIYGLDINLYPTNGQINLNNHSNLRIVASNGFVPVNTVFENGSINGTGRIIIEGKSILFFKNSIQCNVGIELKNGPCEFIDSTGISPSFIILKAGVLKTVTNTVIQDSFIVSTGIIGHIAYMGNFVVDGMTKITGGSLAAQSLKLRDTAYISNFYIQPNAILIIDSSAIWIMNHCNTELIHVTGPNNTLTSGRVLIYGTIKKSGCGKSKFRYNVFEFRGNIEVSEGYLELEIPNDLSNNQGFEEGNILIQENAKFCVFTYQAVTTFVCNAYVAFVNLGEICFGTNVTFDIIVSGELQGVYSGNGNISSPNITNTGVLNPGFSPGKLTLSNLTNSIEGQVNIEIANVNNPGVNYDQIAINGPFIINGGILKIELINGFVPSLGNSFIIFTHQGVIGAFDAILAPNLPSNRGWKIDYNATNITLTYLQKSWKDSDGDSYGDFNNDTLSLTVPINFVSNFDDCDDTDAMAFPSSTFVKTYADGNWDDPSVWLCGSPSVTTDSILIKNIVNLNVTSLTLTTNIEIMNGTLNVLSNSALNLGNSLNYSQLILQNNATIHVQPNATIQLEGTLISNIGTNINNEGQIIIKE